MNSKRAEQVHYIPPGRRKPVVQAPLATVAPPHQSASQPSPPGFPTLYHINSSAARLVHEPPTSNHVLPVSRFEPTTTPPLRANDGMRSSHSNSHGRIQPQRRDSYEVGMSPTLSPVAIHHPRELTRLEHAREHKILRPGDTFHRGEKSAFESPRIAVNSPVTKYSSPIPPMARNRSYEQQERYTDIPPPPLRGKIAPQTWMDDFGKKNPGPPPVIRILRNPDRERERERENREIVDEHVTRSFVLPPRPDHMARARTYPKVASTGSAQYLGESIHSLTPTTSLQDRCRKFINSLHPERPDPPDEDDPYEYPWTTPCNSKIYTGARNTRKIVSERSPAPPNLDHDYFTIPINKPVGKRRRPRNRGRSTDHDDESSTDDCNRRLYRLHT